MRPTTRCPRLTGPGSTSALRIGSSARPATASLSTRRSWRFTWTGPIIGAATLESTAKDVTLAAEAGDWYVRAATRANAIIDSQSARPLWERAVALLDHDSGTWRLRGHVRARCRAGRARRDRGRPGRLRIDPRARNQAKSGASGHGRDRRAARETSEQCCLGRGDADLHRGIPADPGGRRRRALPVPGVLLPRREPRNRTSGRHRSGAHGCSPRPSIRRCADAAGSGERLRRNGGLAARGGSPGERSRSTSTQRTSLAPRASLSWSTPPTSRRRTGSSRRRGRSWPRRSSLRSDSGSRNRSSEPVNRRLARPAGTATSTPARACFAARWTCRSGSTSPTGRRSSRPGSR